MTISPSKILLILAIAITGALVAQEVKFTANVRLVRLLVTVKNPSGDLVGSLEQDQFRVSDNGVPQDISVFEHHTEQPLSVSVLVDISGSTAKELRYETQSVTRFLKALISEGNSEDAAALFTFNWQVREDVHFTRRILRLETVLKQLKAEGGTSLYDAIYLAAPELGERDGRHVMVIVTDGGDTTSTTDFHKALEAAQRADAVIYPILVMPITNDAGRNIGGENALTSFANGTGGRVFTPNIGAKLDAAFEEILRDLRTQYLIGYYPKNIPLTKERFHRVRVELKRPDLRAITRSGYYGDAEDGAGKGSR